MFSARRPVSLPSGSRSEDRSEDCSEDRSEDRYEKQRGTEGWLDSRFDLFDFVS